MGVGGLGAHVGLWIKINAGIPIQDPVGLTILWCMMNIYIYKYTAVVYNLLIIHQTTQDTQIYIQEGGGVFTSFQHITAEIVVHIQKVPLRQTL